MGGTDLPALRKLRPRGYAAFLSAGQSEFQHGGWHKLLGFVGLAYCTSRHSKTRQSWPLRSELAQACSTKHYQRLASSSIYLLVTDFASFTANAIICYVLANAARTCRSINSELRGSNRAAVSADLQAVAKHVACAYASSEQHYCVQLLAGMAVYQCAVSICSLRTSPSPSPKTSAVSNDEFGTCKFRGCIATAAVLQRSIASNS